MSNVLVVDNSLFIRTSLQKILEDSGHKVVGTASNGKEALEQYTSLKPDVVTLDLVMDAPNRLSMTPEEAAADGLAALRNIRLRDPKAVVVVITAGRQLGERAKAMGALEVIFKPLDPAQVRKALLHAVLASKKARLAQPPAPGPGKA